MNLLNAARQALITIETQQAWGDVDPSFFAETITALRQAIEQAEFDAVHDALEKEAGIHITQQAEQQEPVMWVDVDEEGHIKLFRDYSDGNPNEVALYDTFVAQKPLTDLEIDRLWIASPPKELEGVLFRHIRFARTVERAHGIGGGE